MNEFRQSLAVIIGINQYVNDIPPLETAVNDASQLDEILRNKYQYKTLLLLDTDATLSKLNNLLAAFTQQKVPLSDGSEVKVDKSDRLLFYFAGHGIAKDALENADGPAGFLIPQDGQRDDGWLSMQRLHDALVQLPCRHMLIILDCCFAGTFRWATLNREAVRSQKLYQERYARYIRGNAQQVITSAAHDEKAADYLYRFGERGEIHGHSPFAELLFKALDGEGDITNDGAIIATELYLYLDRELSKKIAKQTPGFCQLRGHDKGEYIFVLPGFNPKELPKAPELNENTNPYKGLESFEEEDSHKFCGRTALTESLVKFVTQHKLTVVLGASGAGKSSLVKAGLIPKLRKTQQWRILPPFRPGESPFNALNYALQQEKLPIFEMACQIRRPATSGVTNSEDTSWYSQGLEKLYENLIEWRKHNSNSNLLLVIDQFEELIALSRDDTERNMFLSGLATAIETFPDWLRIVVTLRSDFEPQFRDTALEPYWTEARFFVPAMTRAELRQAIVEPATAKVLYFEPPDLVERLIDEVVQMPGALPLLSFTLSELYFKYIKSAREDTRNNRSITQEDYLELGGVAQSLTKRADWEYQQLVNLDNAYAKTIRHVMLRMVAIGGGELARRRVLDNELVYPEPENERVQRVIERFCAARLLVQGQDVEGNGYVEPAHDFLVRGWSKLLRWQQQNEGYLILQRQVMPAALEWNSHQLTAFHWSANPRDWWKQFWDRQQQANFLWDRNPRLYFLKQVLDSTDNWFNQVEAEFVQRSIERQRNNRSRTISLVVAGFAVVLGFAGFQWYQTQLAQIKTLTASSKELFASDQKFDALIEGLKAEKKLKMTIGVDNETRFQALTALQQAVYWVRESNRLQGPSGQDGSIAWSPDGKMLASGSRNGTIKLWSLEGKVFKTLKHSRAVPIFSVSFSPDGKMLASGSADRTIKLWNQDGKALKTLKHRRAVLSVAWSPDGKMLASGSSDRTIKLWNKDGKFLKMLKHSRAVLSVAWSPDGKMLASGSADGIIKLWKQDGNEFKTLKHSGQVASISFSPDSKLLVSGTTDKTVKLWRIADGKELKMLKPHSDSIRSVAWSPDGKMFISASIDKTVILWSFDGKLLSTIKNSTWVENAAWSPDGKMLAWRLIDGTIKLWTLQGKFLKTLTGHGDVVRSVSFSPDSKMLASGSDDMSVKLWNVEGNSLPGIKERHSGKVYTVAWSPDGKRLASGSQDNKVKLWSLTNGKVQTLEGHHGNVRSVARSPDGKMLASGSEDKTVMLWSFEGKLIRTINNSRGVESLAWSPDGKLLASGSENGTIKLWSLTNGKTQTLEGHRREVRSVDWSPDGKLLVSGSTDGTIKLWSLENRKELWTRNVEGGWVYSVSFSPDGKLLASASDIGIVKLWNLENKQLMRLSGHSDVVRSIAWSPDGKLLASASSDKTVLLWNLELLDRDILLQRGCEWVDDYLKTNPNVTQEERHLCD